MSLPLSELFFTLLEFTAFLASFFRVTSLLPMSSLSIQLLQSNASAEENDRGLPHWRDTREALPSATESEDVTAFEKELSLLGIEQGKTG